jgi:hypothetical protein
MKWLQGLALASRVMACHSRRACPSWLGDSQLLLVDSQLLSGLLGGHACNMWLVKGHCLVKVAVVLVQSVDTSYSSSANVMSWIEQ